MIRDRRSQRGVSLAEAMITTFVLMLVMMAFYASFDSAQKTSGQIDARLQHLGEAQKLVRAASKDIRTATPVAAGGSAFEKADKREVIFYGYLDQGYNTTTAGTLPVPERVRLWVDATDPKAPLLKEETQEADAATGSPTYGVKPVKLRLLGTYIYNTSSEPLFRYFDVNGSELTNVPLSNADQKLVRSVQIEFKVRKTTAIGVKATAVRTTVRLPNVIYGVPPGT